MNQLILLAVAEKLAARRAYKQFAFGDLAARKARLGDRSREQLCADFNALMDERRDQTPVEGDELPLDSK